MDPNANFRVLRLIGSNFMKMKAFDITPQRHINKLTGQNGSGKSSTIASIEAAFGGPRSFPEKPVRDGADEAELVCIIGEEDNPGEQLLVHRIISKDGKQSVKVTQRGGFDAGSPQGFLDSIYSKSADPLAFLLMEPKKQLELLQRVVGLDFTDIDIERKKLYDQRTKYNTDAAEKTAQANGVVVPPDTPTDEVSIADLMAEQRNRQAFNDGNKSERDKLAQLTRDVAAQKIHVANATREVTDLEERLIKARSKLESTNAALAQAETLRATQQSTVSILEDKDVAGVQQQIVAAQDTNRNVAKSKRKSDLLKEAESAKSKSAELTTKIDAIDANKNEKLAAAKWPVAGLGFGSGGITFDGIPFSQASSAQKATVGFGMSLSLKPKLKLAFLKNASLFDEKHLQTVYDLAYQNDMQVFAECVADPAGPGTFVIEDGEVVNVNGVPASEHKADPPPSFAKPKKAKKETPSKPAPWEAPKAEPGALPF